MADRLEQLIEMECADALLDSGVLDAITKDESTMPQRHSH